MAAGLLSIDFRLERMSKRWSLVSVLGKLRVRFFQEVQKVTFKKLKNKLPFGCLPRNLSINNGIFAYYIMADVYLIKEMYINENKVTFQWYYIFQEFGWHS